MGITCSSLRCCLFHREQEPPLQQIPSSGETPFFLPSDVIFDILCRIPVKALCRLRCVSSEWCTLISSPEFAAAHKSRWPAEPLLVLASYRDTSLRLIDMDGCLVRVINNDMGGRYWTPCCTGIDGTICVASYSSAGFAAGVIHLATTKVLATRLEHYSGDGYWGLGRAVPSGVCKVVRFTSRQTEVFTLGDACAGWRRTKSHPPCTSYHTLHSALVNGMLHFLAVDQPEEDSRILRFDLEREEWGNMIKGPPNVKTRPTRISLCELSDALCMVEPEIWELTYGRMNIWLLTDAGKSIWVKAYTVPFDTSKYYRMVPLRVLHDNGPMLLLCTITWTGRQTILQIYDPRHGTCIDATKNQLCDHVSTVDYHISVVLCNMQLEHFVSPKIQHLSTLSQVFL